MTASDDPKRLGRFEILHPLGEGGMGKVYLARDASMERQVAIKTIHASMDISPKLHERFLREAKAAGALSHPNLVTVHEYGEDEGTCYLVMEYLPGMDLSVFLAKRSLTPAESLDVMAQICDGLAYAHSKGVVHRDVKPTNVRVLKIGGRLHAKLMDFGVAHVPGSSLTATGDLVGTFNYMAPEYLRSGEADVRCDLYAVGMMLHEALTGELPSMAPTLPGSNAAESAASRPTLEGISPRTWEIVEKALAPASRRFHSAEGMAKALRAAMQPNWGGLEEQDLPKVRSVADTPAPLPTVPTSSGGRPAAAFQPILRPEADAPPKATWWPLALLALLAGGGLWMWKAQQPGPAPAPQTAPPSVPIPDRTREQPAALAQGPQAIQAPSQERPPSLNQPPQPRPEPPAAGQRPDEPGRHEPGRNEPSRAVQEMEAALARLRDRPREAADAAEAVLREQPSNSLAHAMRFASAYWMGRDRDLVAALEDAQRQGVEGRRFGSYECVHDVMRAERAQPRLARDVVDRVRAYLPPPGERQDGPSPMNRK
jgi:serine/threonine protein kinase